ncbi:MAG: hypothetical protein ACI361_01525 [Atopobiaceae bacterium]
MAFSAQSDEGETGAASLLEGTSDAADEAASEGAAAVGTEDAIAESSGSAATASASAADADSSNTSINTSASSSDTEKSASSAKAAPMLAASLAGYSYDQESVDDGNGNQITVSFQGNNVLPEGAKMQLTLVADDSVQAQAAAATAASNQRHIISHKTVHVRFVDAGGNDVTPAGPVRLTVNYSPSMISGDMCAVYAVSGSTARWLSGSDNSKNATNFAAISDMTLAQTSDLVIGIQIAASYVDGHMTDYSLGNILTKYTVFAQNEATGTHQVGAIATGGDATFSSLGDGSVKQQAYNFVGGNANIKSFASDGLKDKSIVYSERNMDRHLDTQQVTKIWSHDKDPYIDMDAAFKSIKSEIGSVEADITNSNSWQSGFATVTNVDGSTTHQEATGGKYYKVDSIADLTRINKIPLDSDTIIYCTASGEISFNNQLKFNDENGNDLQTQETGEGMSITWIFPNATKVHLTNGPFFGHVIVPNGDIVGDGGGNYSGALVAKNVYVGAAAGQGGWEGHLFPWRISILSATRSAIS